MEEIIKITESRLGNILSNDFLVKFFKEDEYMRENLYRQILILRYLKSEKSKEYMSSFESKGLKFNEEMWQTEFDDEEVESEMEFFYNAVKDTMRIDLDNVKEPPKAIKPQPSKTNKEPVAEQKVYDTTNDIKTDIKDISKIYVYSSKPKYMPMWNKISAIAVLITGVIFAIGMLSYTMYSEIVKLTVVLPNEQNHSQWDHVARWPSVSMFTYILLIIRIGIMWMFIRIFMDATNNMKKYENFKYGKNNNIFFVMIVAGLYMGGYEGAYNYSQDIGLKAQLFAGHIDNFNNQELNDFFTLKRVVTIVSIAWGAILVAMAVITEIIKPQIDPKKIAEIARVRNQIMIQNIERMKKDQERNFQNNFSTFQNNSNSDDENNNESNDKKDEEKTTE